MSIRVPLRTPVFFSSFRDEWYYCRFNAALTRDAFYLCNQMPLSKPAVDPQKMCDLPWLKPIVGPSQMDCLLTSSLLVRAVLLVL